MIIAAHRGFSASYPENTMLAFQKAVDAGCDAIELDVQLSKDGVVVIIHDETIERVAKHDGWVKDLYYEGLASLNVAAWRGKSFGANGVPSLDDYLNWVKDLNVITNIELKNSLYVYPELEEKTIALVRKFKLEDRVILSSFNHPSLIKCKRLAPEIKCGALLDRNGIINPGFYCKSLGIEYYHPSVDILTPEAVFDCLAWDIGISVWTVDDAPTLKKLAALNIFAVITNNPQSAREALQPSQ